ncbi:MAG: hypothetical protein AAGC95_05725 [Pseudomonadota bacterium]
MIKKTVANVIAEILEDWSQPLRSDRKSFWNRKIESRILVTWRTALQYLSCLLGMAFVSTMISFQSFANDSANDSGTLNVSSIILFSVFIIPVLVVTSFRKGTPIKFLLIGLSVGVLLARTASLLAEYNYGLDTGVSTEGPVTM